MAHLHSKGKMSFCDAIHVSAWCVSKILPLWNDVSSDSVPFPNFVVYISISVRRTKKGVKQSRVKYEDKQVTR